MTSVLHADEWMSQVLERPVFKMVWPDDCDSGEMETGLRDDISHLPSGAAFAYAKISPDSVDRSRLLSRVGFYLVDTNIQFSKILSAQGSEHMSESCRLARPDDEAAVVALAEQSFAYSRFHIDPAFANEIANRLKREWVRNFFLGKRGAGLVVAEWEGQVAGFSLLLRDSRRVVIDLIAVAPAFRRHGLGRALCDSSGAAIDGTEELLVGTQLANEPAMQLYEHMGYRRSGASYVYHWHQGVI